MNGGEVLPRPFYFMCPGHDCLAILETRDPAPGELGKCAACGSVLRFTESLRVEISTSDANIHESTAD